MGELVYYASTLCPLHCERHGFMLGIKQAPSLCAGSYCISRGKANDDSGK